MTDCLAPVPFPFILNVHPHPCVLHSNRLTLKLGEAWFSSWSWKLNVGCFSLPGLVRLGSAQGRDKDLTIGIPLLLRLQPAYPQGRHGHRRERGTGCIRYLSFAWGLGHLRILLDLSGGFFRFGACVWFQK